MRQAEKLAAKPRSMVEQAAAKIVEGILDDMPGALMDGWNHLSLERQVAVVESWRAIAKHDINSLDEARSETP